jgi:hypothetical protein
LDEVTFEKVFFYIPFERMFEILQKPRGQFLKLKNCPLHHVSDLQGD